MQSVPATAAQYLASVMELACQIMSSLQNR